MKSLFNNGYRVIPTSFDALFLLMNLIGILADYKRQALVDNQAFNAIVIYTSITAVASPLVKGGWRGICL
jgi:hypothetical protein